MVAGDVYRPAAIDQLKVLGEKIQVTVYSEDGVKDPVKIAQNAIKEAKLKGFNTVIIDTAGRLSIDEEVWSMNGRYGIDYPAEKYREYLDEAHIRLRNKLVKLIQDNKQVVVDSSFWQRSERDEFKQLVEKSGGKWRLIYLKAP